MLRTCIRLSNQITMLHDFLIRAIFSTHYKAAYWLLISCYLTLFFVWYHPAQIFDTHIRLIEPKHNFLSSILSMCCIWRRTFRPWVASSVAVRILLTNLLLVNVRMTSSKFVKSILTATDVATHGRNVRLANPE